MGRALTQGVGHGVVLANTAVHINDAVYRDGRKQNRYGCGSHDPGPYIVRRLGCHCDGPSERRCSENPKRCGRLGAGVLIYQFQQWRRVEETWSRRDGLPEEGGVHQTLPRIPVDIGGTDRPPKIAQFGRSSHNVFGEALGEVSSVYGANGCPVYGVPAGAADGELMYDSGLIGTK